MRQEQKQGLLRLSQKIYTNKTLERFKMDKYSAGVVPTQKLTNLNYVTSEKRIEGEQMKNTRHAFVVQNLMYGRLAPGQTAILLLK